MERPVIVASAPMASVEERAHRNYCDFLRFVHRLDPGRFVETDTMVAVTGAVDWPSSRIALRKGASEPAAWVEQLETFLFADGKTACVFLRIGPDDDVADMLVRRGYTEYGTTPEMVCDRALPDRPPPGGVTARLATSRDDLFAYATVAGSAFRHLGLPEDDVRTALEHPDVLLAPDVAIAVAEAGGRIVAGALVALLGTEPNGYVGWVAVADDARGQGLGDTVTRLVTNEGFTRGAQLVTLEASHFGENTYRRMGYRELYRYRMLIKV